MTIKTAKTELGYAIEYANSAIIQLDVNSDVETALKYVKQAEAELNHARDFLKNLKGGEKHDGKTG